jgi:glycosyltransferase involved in cell wall biosynthesis
MSSMVVTVADTILGYGSSQILMLTKSLAARDGGRHMVFQPFVPQRAYTDLSTLGYDIETVATVEHPWSFIGREQYLRHVAGKINALRPETLVLPNYNIVPILSHLNYRPRKIIHLVLEDLEQFGNSRAAQLLIRNIQSHSDLIDLWIFPDEKRAEVDTQRLSIPFSKTCIVYNVYQGHIASSATEKRSKRILYAGSVDFDRTVAHFFTHPSVSCLPIDVYGQMSGSADLQRAFLDLLRSNTSNIRYFGEMPSKRIDDILTSLAYSLVFWFPASWSLRNAAPNKFYQALAAGVPVISAPHPQCATMINRYNCGYALKDWSLEALQEGLRTALADFNTACYREKVEGCREAVKQELNWDRQFSKITALLE